MLQGAVFYGRGAGGASMNLVSVSGRPTCLESIGCPDLKARRIVLENTVSKIIGRRERVVAQIDITFDCECPFSIRKELAGGLLVVEPGEDGVEGVETAVEDFHGFWRQCPHVLVAALFDSHDGGEE